MAINFRSLEGYKATHAHIAKDKGVADKFLSAPTLTRARRILFGAKQKQLTCRCGQENCKRRSGGKASHC